MADAIAAVTSPLTPVIPGCISPSKDITYLIWPLRRVQDDWLAQVPYSGTRDRQLRLEPYTSILNMLREWILATCPLPKTPPPHNLLMEPTIALQSWPPEALAYMLLRQTCECCDAWWPAAPIRLVCLTQCSEVLRLWQRVQDDPVSVRALTLATFAAFYWRLKRSPELITPPCQGNDSITTAFLSDRSDPMFGAVWFPTIPGPIEEEAHKRCYISLTKALALLGQACSRERRASARKDAQV